MSASPVPKLEFWFLGFIFEQVGTNRENKKQVRQQDHKSSCGENFG
jgi:hypothetical protein